VMEMVHFIPPSQRRLAMLAAQSEAPVLISGAQGTGRGAIARWIHQTGPRAGRPLVIASHEIPFSRHIMEAQGGTFVIPEIGEWGLAEQKSLLTFLRTKSVPDPDRNGLRVLLNVRIIASSSQALDGRARGGLFNPELLEALNVFRLDMPPLAQRNDEFDDIVTGILGEITRELHKEHLRSVSPEAWQRLRAYDWPGNIRELRNVLRVAVIQSAGDRIEPSSLPDFGHDRVDFRATREQFEKIYLLELLKTFNGELDRAAQASRMDPGALRAKALKYGIELNERELPNA
jgi:DNA-binding NtrC family response regulator